MRRILLLFFTVLINSTADVQAGNWLTNLEQAQKLALSTDKLILVDFWASWCGPCKRMDKESWSDPEIQKMMQDYIPVQIDLDRNQRDAMKYGVRSIPYIFIIDGNGEVVYQSLGYMKKDQVKEVLQKYALNTSFLRQEAVTYYQHQNYVTSLRLAEKYLDYSLYLKENIKADFLKVAEKYLKQSDKLLKRKQKNYRFIKEKIELLEINAALYADDQKTLQKFLKQTSPKDLDPKNRPLFAYINLCANRNVPAEAEKWAQVLEEAQNNDKYFVKAKLFSKEEI